MLVLQWQIEGSFGDAEDLEFRHEVEELVGEVLSAENLGSVDGGDIGSGKMSIYCLVGEADAVAACKAIVAKLDEQGIEDTVIAFLDDEDEEAEPNVLYPEDYAGTFSVL